MKKLMIPFLFAIAVFIGCNGIEENNSGVLMVRLIDSPAEYEEVLIDVQELLLNVADDDSGWTELPLLVKGQIDLLQLTNGNDTLLSEESLPPGRISQMRMVLGDNNQLKMGGEYYDLETPSAQQSGLKFNIHTTIEEGVTYEMWIDFDASKSIVEKGNGTYSLKPVIKTFTEATSGSIIGTISPAEVKSVVYAISSSNDTTSTYPDSESGDFLLRGLDAGTYKIEVEPEDGYSSVEKENVSVEIGKSIDIGVLNLMVQ